MPVNARDTKRFWKTGLLLLALLALVAGRVYAESKDFSIVVLPDPQHYASKYLKIGAAQTEWIAENAQKLQIKFVVSVGDNVDHGWIDAEFKHSVSFMDKLNNVVPYGVAVGNHDLMDGKKKSYTSLKFLDYYGPQRFKTVPLVRRGLPFRIQFVPDLLGRRDRVPCHRTDRRRTQARDRVGEEGHGRAS